jgi:hypothetical protein
VEKISNPARYTNKVDVWALGCILFELLVGRKPFCNDFGTYQYYSSAIMLEISSIPAMPMIAPSHLSRIVHELLHRHPQERPSATESLPIFRSYITVLQHQESFSSRFDTLQVIPPYPRWKELVQACEEEESEIFCQWAGWYVSTKDYTSAVALLTCVILNTRWYRASRVAQLEKVYVEIGDWELAVTDWKRLVGVLTGYPGLRGGLARFCAKGNVPSAMALWNELLEKYPNSGFLTFPAEVFDNLETWQSQITWLKSVVTHPHESLYHIELNNVLEEQKYYAPKELRNYTQARYLFDQMWEQILLLVTVCRSSLTLKLDALAQPLDITQQREDERDALRTGIKYIPPLLQG